MQNNLLRSFFFKNNLFMQKELIKIYFFLKKTYSKHLIYAKQLITIYF